MKRAALSLAFATLLAAGSAAAFRTAGDTADFAGTERVRWQSDTIGYSIVEGAPEDLPSEEVTRVVEQALGTWSAPACSSVEFSSNGFTASAAEPNDAQNSITWVRSGWSERGFASDAAAITDLAYEQNSDGEWTIVEGDIYLNADNHAWVLEGAPPDGARDLLSVMTHEGGHLLGLMHPCEPGGADDAPDCKSKAAFKATTMYPFYDPGQADLDTDDSAGVCFLYSGDLCGANGCGAGSVCRPEGCLAECGKRICKADERCSVDGCIALGDCVGDSCKKCTLDADCRANAHCGLGGYCVGDAVDGDPCASDSTCAGGVCSADGFCESLCSSSADCPNDYQCQITAGDVGRCIGGKKPLGETCEDPTQCVGGICLKGAATEPVCSRECGHGDAYCPAGWDCHGVEDKAVCRPFAATDGGTERCSVNSPGASGARANTTALTLLGILGALFTLRLRRRKRRST